MIDLNHHTTFKVHWAVGNNPEQDLAKEEDLLAMAAQGIIGMSMFTWSTPAVVLGYNQSADDVDSSECASDNIPILRRITGGTGIVHHNDLGVSLALPVSHPWAYNIRTLYHSFLCPLSWMFRNLGIFVEIDQRSGPPIHPSRICLENPGADGLLYSGKRVAGGAQARRIRSVLVHTHISLKLDPSLYARLFRVDADHVRDVLTSLPWSGADPTRLMSLVTDAVAAALEMEPQWDPSPLLHADSNLVRQSSRETSHKAYQDHCEPAIISDNRAGITFTHGKHLK